jgi:hypothetical protein
MLGIFVPSRMKPPASPDKSREKPGRLAGGGGRLFSGSQLCLGSAFYPHSHFGFYSG